MSRSYKKTPWCGDKKGKDKKRIANHVVRQALKRDLDLVVQNGDYKKLYCSWEICDYGWRTTWEEYWAGEWRAYRWIKNLYPNREHKEPDEKECRRKWQKYYRDK